MNSQPNSKTNFKNWMSRVDRILSVKYFGITSDDLPDQCYQDWYEDGLTPIQAVSRAIKNSDE